MLSSTSPAGFILVGCLALLLGRLPAAAQGAPSPPVAGAPQGRAARQAGPVFAPEITSQLKVSVARGFEYLRSHQGADGSFAGAEGYPVAVDALVGLALLAGGYTDKEGPYTDAMRRGIHHLLGFQNDGGYFDDGESRMYGHGFAALFLAELYGMTGERNDDVRSALKRAVRVIERSQADDGGWDYYPKSPFGVIGASEGSDTSITVCQAMALRAARNLGIQVDGGVVERARTYIRRAQNPDGGFCYRLVASSRWGPSSLFPRSAAGVCILFSLAKPEDYGSAELRRGYDYLSQNSRSYSQFPYYGHYYCTQAMFQAGGRYWAEYFPYLRDLLVSRQRADGSWAGAGMEITGQTTAMALIALQIPLRFLPITER